MLSYLGETWGAGTAPRFTTEQAVKYTRKIPAAFMGQLTELGKAEAKWDPDELK